MPLNNVQIAEALLRLFDLIDPTYPRKLCENLDSLPEQKDPIQKVTNLVKIIDSQREGELFSINPPLKLLETAYNNGIRLELIAADHVRHDDSNRGLKINILQNGKILKCVNIIAESGLNLRVDQRLDLGVGLGRNMGLLAISHIDTLWQELHKITFGKPKPDYNFLELGAHILSKLSMRRTSYQQFADEQNKFWQKQSRYDLIMPKQNKVNECFYVKHDWNLTSINDENIRLLEKLLSESFHAAGYKDAIFTLIPDMMTCASSGNRIDGLDYWKNKDSLYLRATLLASNPDAFELIDFKKVLDIFMRKNPKVDLSPRHGDKVAKVTYFTAFSIYKKENLPGRLSKEEMLQIQSREKQKSSAADQKISTADRLPSAADQLFANTSAARNNMHSELQQREAFIAEMEAFRI